MTSVRTLVGLCLVAGAAVAYRSQSPASDHAVADSMNDHMAHMAMGDLAAPMIASENLASQQRTDLPPSANAAAARLAASPRHAEWVKIAWEPGSKDSLMAWIVYPSTSRPHTPVVVVVHEIFGLSTWVRSVADQVAAEGFIAIAPDLNSRVRGGPSTEELSADSARKIIRGVDAAERNRGITAAARFAMSQPSAEQKYAVIGFCWGGQTVWMHAVNGGTTGFSGGVAYYGLPYMQAAQTMGGQAGRGRGAAVPARDSLVKIRVPVMLLSGSKDARIGAAMPAVEAMMKELGKNYFGRNYEGAIHGFMRAQDDPRAQRDEAEEQANLAAARDAWPRTVEFLKKNLGLQ